jgi:hypothetical protein
MKYPGIVILNEVKDTGIVLAAQKQRPKARNIPT